MGEFRFPSKTPVAADGTPEYVVHCEQYLIGSALLASLPDLQPATRIATDLDFHDDALGRIWYAVCYLALTDSEATLPAVAAMLLRWGELDEVGGETRLASLAGHPYAFLYAGTAALQAHAGIVHEWGEKRRTIDGLSKQADAVYRGRSPLPNGWMVL